MPSQAMQDVIDGLRDQQKASASQAPVPDNIKRPGTEIRMTAPPQM